LILGVFAKSGNGFMKEGFGMKNGRIAIPSIGSGGMDGQRSGHFGHCDVFTVVDVEEGQVKTVSTIPNQSHVQGGCMVPVNLLAENNVSALIVGGIGMRPLIGFRQVGIDVYHDEIRPEIRPVVEDLIAGKLPLIGDDQVCGGGAVH
jgi:predicted Fe-Mo cluster-binding NifX family protein